MQEEKYVKSFDGELIYAKEYTCPEPVGLIILTTDIKEYAGLYEEFALNLVDKNFNVFTYFYNWL